MPSPPPKVLEIRKYPNRRYYDSTRSTMVTLEDMCQLIRNGHDLRITDSKTGEDLTAKVLAQIILDLDSGKLDAFPVALLHRLIRSNEEMTRQFIEKYFHQAFEAFQQSQKSFEAHMRRFMGLGASGADGGWFGSGAPSFLSGWNPDGSEKHSGTDQKEPKEAPSQDALNEQLEQLKREIEGLKKTSDRTTQTKAKKNTKTKAKTKTKTGSGSRRGNRG